MGGESGVVLQRVCCAESQSRRSAKGRRARAHVPTPTNARPCTSMHAHAHPCTHTNTHARSHAQTCTRMHVRAHPCMPMLTQAHTHAHPRTPMCATTHSHLQGQVVVCAEAKPKAVGVNDRAGVWTAPRDAQVEHNRLTPTKAVGIDDLRRCDSQRRQVRQPVALCVKAVVGAGAHLARVVTVFVLPPRRVDHVAVEQAVVVAQLVQQHAAAAPAVHHHPARIECREARPAAAQLWHGVDDVVKKLRVGKCSHKRFARVRHPLEVLVAAVAGRKRRQRRARHLHVHDERARAAVL
mmetsp:Transcript_5870/g.17978  ORF Transcript_5870/g.17978 Transcript_5870/m.17978 type:complete len:295 (-) Transcript_5870:481-1365(-)